MIVDRVRYSSHRSHRGTPHHAAAGALIRRAGVAQHGMVVAVGRIVLLLLLLYTAVCWRGDAIVIPATAAGMVQEPRVQRRGGGGLVSGTRRLLTAVLRVLIRIDAAGWCRRCGIGCRRSPRG
jgi:hypothetical protein